MKAMKTLDRLDADALRNARILLTDIDDTITSEGQLEAKAYDALHRLSAAGIAVIPVTGRPAGWRDHIARMWPGPSPRSARSTSTVGSATTTS